MQEFPLVLTPLYQPYQIWTSTSMGIDSCDNLHRNIIAVTQQRQFAKFPLDQHLSCFKKKTLLQLNSCMTSELVSSIHGI